MSASASPAFVLVAGAGATSMMWTPLVRELAVLGCRASPVELPGHGFDAVFPAGCQYPANDGTVAAG